MKKATNHTLQTKNEVSSIFEQLDRYLPVTIISMSILLGLGYFLGYQIDQQDIFKSQTEITDIKNISTVNVNTKHNLQSLLDTAIGQQPIEFKSATSNELTENSTKTLDEISSAIKDHPETITQIIVNVNLTNTQEASEQLAAARAESIINYFKSQNVASENITSKWEVSEKPISDNVSFIVLRNDPNSMPVGLIYNFPTNESFINNFKDSINKIKVSEQNLHINEIDLSKNIDIDTAINNLINSQVKTIIIVSERQIDNIQTLSQEHKDIQFVVYAQDLDNELQNLSSFFPASDQGGYVLGALAADLSNSKKVSLIASIREPDTKKLISGFNRGANEAGDQVKVFTDSVDTNNGNDLERAFKTQLSNKSDVILSNLEVQKYLNSRSGIYNEQITWLSNQAKPNSEKILASQIYNWDIYLTEVLTEVSEGRTSNKKYTATIENKGIEIQTNNSISSEQKNKVDSLIKKIENGEIQFNN